MGSRDIIKYAVVCSRICTLLLLTPPITTPNSSLSYTMEVYKHSTTCISDHLYQKTTFILLLILISLVGQ